MTSEERLGRARLDELLEEVLQRVGEVLDGQDRLRGLLDAVISLAGDLSLDSVLQRIVTTASELVRARYGALGVLAPATIGDSTGQRRLQEFVTYGITDEQRARIGDLPRGHGLLGLIIDDPRPVRLDSIGSHPRSYGFPPNHPPMGSFLGVPIRIRDRAFGNLYLTEKQGGGGFTVEDEQVVVALAAAAGVVIENARLYAETRRRQRWLQASAETTAALLGEVGWAQGRRLIAEQARHASEADLVAVLARRDDQEDLVIRAVAGSAAPEDLLGLTVAADKGLGAAILADVPRLLAPDLAVETQLAEGCGALLEAIPRGALIAQQLYSDGAVSGALVIGWKEPHYSLFAATDPALISSFAEQVDMAMQVAKAREDRAMLAVLADRDRIGRDLHDQVIQRLFAIGLALENVARLAAEPELAGRLTAAVDEIDATIREIRRTIFELGSGRGALVDLRAELVQILDEQSVHLGFRPALLTDGPVDSAVPDEVRPHLLAVLRESLSNAARHARATEVAVSLRVGADIELTVRDNGVGADATMRTSGIGNMQDRARALNGSCDVVGIPGEGTTVSWVVPVETGARR